MKPIEIRTLQWKGNTIKLSVLSPALSSDLWEIHYKRKFMGFDRLIFKSYSYPPVTDISIKNNNLKIQSDKYTIIIIDLENINNYIGNPIVYRRSVLKKTNNYYVEPEFIKEGRKFREKYKLL